MRLRKGTVLLAILALLLLALWGGRTALLFIMFLFLLAFLSFFLTSRRLESLSVERKIYPSRLSIGESARIELTFTNPSRLPLMWLEVWDFLPPYIVAKSGVTRFALTLRAKEKRVIRYTVQANKRGEFELSPLLLATGDPWGLWRREARIGAPSSLVVFPRLIPLSGMKLPLLKPFEGRKTGVRAYEDFTAISGTRDYLPSDPLKRIHWKLFAHLGKPRVKEFEFSSATTLVVWLDLVTSLKEFELPSIYEDYAATAAAAILHHAMEEHIPTYLQVFPFPRFFSDLGKGKDHFIRQMESLARARTGEGDLVELMREASQRLPWQSNLILISSLLSPEILGRLVELRLRAKHLSLYLIYEGSFLLPGEKPRKSFQFDLLAVQQLRERSKLLQGEHIHVHLIGGNDFLPVNA